jgi:phage regulator Rha-like protein
MQTELVFIDPQTMNAQPFTTSIIIAEHSDNEHESVVRLLNDYRADFEEFGLLEFSDLKSGNPKGGRPTRLYNLNEEQATLLITYLNNTPQVRAFKKNLVRSFSLMKKRLSEWRISRERSKAAHRTLTDSIRDHGGNHWTYKHLTDLAYKQVTGQTAKQLRASRGADKAATAKDFLTPEELTAIEKLDSLMASLLDSGLDYHGIKVMVLQVNSLRLAS